MSAIAEKIHLIEQLSALELQYNMSTAEFQRRFDAGELGDAPQWFDWDGFAELAASLEAKLKIDPSS